MSLKVNESIIDSKNNAFTLVFDTFEDRQNFANHILNQDEESKEIFVSNEYSKLNCKVRLLDVSEYGMKWSDKEIMGDLRNNRKEMDFSNPLNVFKNYEIDVDTFLTQSDSAEDNTSIYEISNLFKKLAENPTVKFVNLPIFQVFGNTYSVKHYYIEDILNKTDNELVFIYGFSIKRSRLLCRCTFLELKTSDKPSIIYEDAGLK